MSAKIIEVDAYCGQLLGIHGPVVKMLDDYLSIRVQGAFWSPAVRSGKWDGKKHFFSTSTMRFPLYFAEQVREFLAQKEINCDMAIRPIPTLPESMVDSLKLPEGTQLRDYQVDCLKKCIAAGRGIIQAPTASGKTVVIASLVKLYARKTLIIVNRKSLAEQIKDRLERYGLGKIDIVHSEHMDFEDRDVCVCLVQSIGQIEKYLGTYDMLIADEVHFAKAKSYVNIVKQCTKALNRFGFSATIPADGTVEKLQIVALFFQICYNMDVAQLLSREEHIMADPLFLFILNDKAPVYAPDAKPPESANALVDMENKVYVYNMYRNTLVAYVAQKYTALGSKVLVLVRREDHGQVLADIMDCEYMNGAMSIDRRQEMIRRFEKGYDKVLLAQTEIMGVGIDLHGGCDVFIAAGGGRGHIPVIQRVGRALRANENFEVLCVDFDDRIPGCPMAHEHSIARHNICKNTYEEQRVHGIDIDKDSKVYNAVKEACQ